MAAWILLTAVLFLAFANGANDNFKGVATLHGSGRLPFRPALIWATLTTAAGSIAAIFLGSHLVATFSGKGLVPEELVGSLDFVLPVATGAALTVLLATRLGFPISTTHALVGALIGAGLIESGTVHPGALGGTVLLPLLTSPLIAAVLTYLVHRAGRRGRQTLGLKEESCVCVAEQQATAILERTDGSMLLEPAHGLRQLVVHEDGCNPRLDGTLVGLRAQTVLDALHLLSAGAVGFARGLNDTPKIVALLASGALLGVRGGVLPVAAAMALGGILLARRVAHTLSHRITPMNDGQGFAGNLVTAGLVLTASSFGMPVSTTHVSVGALFGIGASSGQGHRLAVLKILASWVVTLPLAALLAAAAAAIG